MKKVTKKYEDYLNEALKNPIEAAAYLNAHLEEWDSDSEELFLMALRDVARAHGISELAEKANLGRESLYKSLSAGGNPKLSTMRTLLKAIGLKISIEALDDEAS